VVLSAPPFVSESWVVEHLDSEGDNGREYIVGSRAEAKRKAEKLSKENGVPIIKDVEDCRM